MTLALAALLAAIGTSAAIASDSGVSTVAGNGSSGSSGDDGTATLAQIDKPEDVSLLPDGGFLIADTQSDRIRHVASNGKITTVAGTGQGGSAGDGGPADEAELRSPGGVAALPGGGFLIADTENDLIRKVAPDGTIETVAGPNLDEPRSVAPLPGGGFLIADTEGHQIRKVDALGIETVVAGTGAEGYSGNGGLALLAKLDSPYDVAPLPGGGFLFSDHDQGVVRKVNALGFISTVAGGGGSDADGIQATSAKLEGPAGVAPLASGGFLVVAEDDHVVRWVSSAGVIQTVAGTGDNGFSGDLGHPLAADFDSPLGLAAAPTGDELLLADTKNNRIRAISLRLVDNGPPGDNDSPRPGKEPAPSPREPERSKPAPPPPVLGQAVAVAPSKGTVRIRARGSKRFVTLSDTDAIPVGSTIDTRRGRVALSSALDNNGKVQTAHFWGGVFKVGQSRSGRGMTDIVLLGGRPSCAPARASISRKRKRSRRGAKLWAKDKRGRFRTRGSNSVATTRGTSWLTQERCKGTLTKVYEGAVVVRNRKTGKRVTVRAGKSYLARRKR